MAVYDFGLVRKPTKQIAKICKEWVKDGFDGIDYLFQKIEIITKAK